MLKRCLEGRVGFLSWLVSLRAQAAQQEHWDVGEQPCCAAAEPWPSSLGVGGEGRLQAFLNPSTWVYMGMITRWTNCLCCGMIIFFSVHLCDTSALFCWRRSSGCLRKVHCYGCSSCCSFRACCTSGIGAAAGSQHFNSLLLGDGEHPPVQGGMLVF